MNTLYADGMPATRIAISESSTLKVVGDRWEAVLISPGVGSSGTYSEAVLSESAARAFPKGTKLWFGHPKEGEGPGDRDGRDQWGFLPEDATYREGVGIVATPQVLPHWKAVVDSLGEQADLSIYAIGESDKDGNVTALLAERTNSVDIVSYAGRPGSGLTQKLEAARASYKTPAEASAGNPKEGNMDEKILEALLALKTSFDTFVTESKTAAAAEVEAEATATSTDEAIEAAVTAFAASTKLIADAKELLPSQVASLSAEAAKGLDITESLAAAKAVVAEALASAPTRDAAGRVVESANGANEDWTVSL